MAMPSTGLEGELSEVCLFYSWVAEKYLIVGGGECFVHSKIEVDFAFNI